MTKFFIDRSTKKVGSRPRVWTMVNNGKPNGSTLSSKEFHEANCSEGMMRILSSNGYTKEMGQGDFSYNTNSPTEWTYPIPNSIRESLFVELCGKKP